MTALNPLADVMERNKAGTTLWAVALSSAVHGHSPLVRTRLPFYEVINCLRELGVDCELEDNMVKGTMQGRPWQFTLSNE